MKVPSPTASGQGFEKGNRGRNVLARNGMTSYTLNKTSIMTPPVQSLAIGRMKCVIQISVVVNVSNPQSEDEMIREAAKSLV